MQNDDSAFKVFVGDTFSKYFWNCTSEIGLKELFGFIRNEVDIKEILQQRTFADLFDIRFWENSYNSEAEVIKTHFFPICQKYFTEEEFQIFLLKPLENNRGTLFSKVCEDQNGELLESIILSISPLTANEKFVRKIKHEVNSSMLFDLCYFMFSCLGTLNIFLIKRVLNCVEKISSLEQIRSALGQTKNNKNLFHVAANRRDLSMLQLMWNFARPRLSDKELEDLLLLGYADNISIIQNAASNGFCKHPPSILNTNCRTAAFEFVPFKCGDPVPEMAVRINEKKVLYIGRCLYDSNMDDYELCKIVPMKKQTTIIEYEDSGKKVATSSHTFEILVGKGLVWTCGGKPRQDCFEFRNYYLEKNDNDDVSLVMLKRSGKNYLAYDDDTSAFTDAVQTGFLYSHQNKVPHDVLY